ncbi:PH domain-containing protein [Streptomyces phaeolivaceus]|uniref:PH domain-containing protein n=1 Tax=Streptomyces phaeolivaceus TaxID=2653200 RepID=UPI00186A3221|nr:PH domain-containing protein [Streptomyces phaeolivaceus]
MTTTEPGHLEKGSLQRPPEDNTPWQRLHGRLILVNAVRLLLSLLPTGLSILFFGGGTRLLDLWPAVIATTVGVFLSIADIVRWLRTRYRITEELVEIRTGRIQRVYRQIPRDRIRAVDVKARLRHRLAGLRVVFVSSGRSRPSLRLDAVTKTMAEELRRELMRNSPAGEAEKESDALKARETVIARLRWSWIFYNVVNIWGLLVGGFLLWSLDSMLNLIDVDLIGTLDRAIDRLAPDPVWSSALWAGVVFLLGLVALSSGFVKDNWDFRLIRTIRDDGTSLVTRQGLLSTREIHRDDGRLRGINLSQPLFWRWAGLTETTVISTGLASWSLSGEVASSILPRCPVGEARRVAARVLPDGARPLEAPLRAHPRAALYRRLIRAVCTAVVLAGLLEWLGATGAVPRGLWVVPLWAFPAMAVLAVIAYRALGHTVVKGYIVMRCGLSRLRTTALRREAVLGLKVRQSLVQKWLGLFTVGVSTAAGERFYDAPDLSADQFMTFANEATPELIGEFLEPTG